MAESGFDRWLSRAGSAVSFWAFMPAGAVAVLSAYLSTGVAWIDQFGAYGWFSSGLVAFLLLLAGVRSHRAHKALAHRG